jgi:hypothetical protein
MSTDQPINSQQDPVNSETVLDSNPKTPLLNGLDHSDIKVFKKRWYILGMFFLLCVGQGIIYNTWSPIQRTARAVFKWDAFMIDLMPALGCIGPCFTIIPLGWLMDVKGMCQNKSCTQGYIYCVGAHQSPPLALVSGAILHY